MIFRCMTKIASLNVDFNIFTGKLKKTFLLKWQIVQVSVKYMNTVVVL